MINGRNKGNAYERKIRKEFIDLGWKDCNTSRFESKKRDDELVDLCNTDPYSIQCKAVERNINYHPLIKDMPNDGNINVVLHKKNRMGEVAVMSKEDFYKLIKELNDLREGKGDNEPV